MEMCTMYTHWIEKGEEGGELEFIYFQPHSGQELTDIEF